MLEESDVFCQRDELVGIDGGLRLGVVTQKSGGVVTVEGVEDRL